ncbi:uncharacterized protein DUF5107 [Streptomyces sp. 2333.5]|uniref:DUF5107 domain-containing protein n=1 Tax=unclassified Streptomyces TaxID=2593676 RepID=UPI00089869F0|nr:MULTISPECIES: DUF5107 domain-containing protein [unclassified Streptomyces]PJJ05502.1 uncharacterized protein DUF5107 [Streptomyces sp. 2333.5]SEF00039.1 protein of unknown function [Streptomyces sp. 2112.2]
MATSVRRTTLTLPAAPLGPDNPLPALCAGHDPHRIELGPDTRLPADMARQLGHAPLRSILPTRMRDGYGRARRSTDVEALVLENDRLRATVLPGLGGRVYSLHHKPTGRELLYRNPVLQPAAFALNGAWFSGGIEWNIGATGHTTLTCAPLHAARLPAPDGGEMLRLWEWERLRDLPFQVDLWLPDGSDFLHVGVRIRNPHPHTVPVYWWSNTAVPEDEGTRVLAPADEAWHFGYAHTLRRVPVPDSEGADRSYPLRSEYPADYFYDVPEGARGWITSLGADGRGLVQTSTGTLRGRKLFLWGAGRAGRRWQQWLTAPGTGGYAEIQAGLARTQLEHVPLDAGGEFAWLEAYGPLETDAAAVHGADWAAARGEVAARLEAVLPRADVDAAYAAWRPYADHEPKESLATGSGWGALEVARAGLDLPGTPFEAATLGAEQEPWLTLLTTGDLPAAGPVPGPALVAPAWRELLESAAPGPATDYHLGLAQWHAGDRAQAVRSWERALAHGAGCLPLYCLAVAESVAGEPARAADRFAQACAAVARAASDEGPRARALQEVLPALAREAVPALLAAGRTAEAAQLLAGLRQTAVADGRFALLTAQVLLAQGQPAAAREIFDAGFEIAALREGDEVLGDTWYAIAEQLVAAGGPVTEDVRATARAAHPLPERYDYQMRPV